MSKATLFNKLAAEESAFLSAKVLAPVILPLPDAETQKSNPSPLPRIPTTPRTRTPSSTPNIAPTNTPVSPANSPNPLSHGLAKRTTYIKTRPCYIKTRISGVTLSLRIYANSNEFAIFQPTSYHTAKRVRKATIVEVSAYLNLFPIIRLIVVGRDDNRWYGIPANLADKRFKITGQIPIELPQMDEVRLFDNCRCRFDGNHVLYEAVDNRNPVIPDVLREQIGQLVPLKNLTITGVTPEELSAYDLVLQRRLFELEEANRDRHEERIRAALGHAGAEYISYVERGANYSIEYRVDGEKHRSTVDKASLQVVSAGICLDGTDELFDLTSLVSVIRLGEATGAIHRVGENRS